MRLALPNGDDSSRMKRIQIIACLLLATLANANPTEPVNPQEAKLLGAIKEVQLQQTTITGNEAKIAEKIAAVAEAVRLARIYSSRSGH
jgi:hypothetical protein